MAVAFDVALPDTPVFVDPSGRRVVLGRRLLILAFAVALAFLVGLLAAAVSVGHPDHCLPAVAQQSGPGTTCRS